MKIKSTFLSSLLLFTSQKVKSLRIRHHSSSLHPTSKSNMKVNMNVNDNLYYFENVNSTMDMAREVLKEKKQETKSESFAVLAGYQTKGRGTNGRAWNSGSHNLYMTIVVKLSSVPVPITLLPLKVGCLIAPSIRSRIASKRSDIYLKWPNDVLIGEKKVCGVLIEIENDSILIGVGCNTAEAPSVDKEGSNGGRPATCLADYNDEYKVLLSEGNTKDLFEKINKDIAGEIYDRMVAWLSSTDSSKNIIEEFKSQMSYGKQFLRLDPKAADGATAGEAIFPIQINIDGTLQVKIENTGEIKTLVADYIL